MRHPGTQRLPRQSGQTTVLDATPTNAHDALHVRAARLLHADGASALDVARQLVSARQDGERWTVPSCARPPN
ncbi:hypothetical protein SANTM175S_01033 [Streptomyces antimycoticus]